MKKVECFKIQILESNDIFDISKGKPIKRIKFNKYCISEPITIIADPFLFVKDDTLFLFYENKRLYHKGVISMIKTKDLINWTDPVTVLEETCHLSYPWVFEENGCVYMIPETCGLKSIRLYVGNDDLTDFKYVKTILYDECTGNEGFSFSDSSVYKKDGIYYLMTSINDGSTNILKLYTSEHFDKEYIEHPYSPLNVSNKYGRNSGSIIKLNEKIYRVAQNCENRYGDNVNLMEILEMTQSSYKEVVVKNNIIPIDTPFYTEGGHHFNMIKFKEKCIIATDAKEYHSFVINKIFHRLRLFSLH